MKTLSAYKPLLFILCILFFASCSKEETGIEQGSLVSVKIKGASEDVNQVILDIEEVQLLVGANEESAKWLSLETTNTGVNNISNFSQGNELILVNSTLVASEKIQKIKLVLGTDNAIILNDETRSFANYEEAAEISNIVPTTLGANKAYEFTLEIKADNSFVIIENNIQFVPEMNTMMRHVNIR